MLEWAAAFVLLIAGANVATLLLAHSTWRRREFAVRHALGASRWRIARDLADESLLLTGAGGMLALVLASWIVAILNHAVSFQDVNRLQPFRIDGVVIAFVAIVTFALTFAFALVPAAVAHDVDVVTTLKDSGQSVSSGTSHRRLRQVLIVTELALSIVLATSALALTQSALALRSFPRGLRVDRVATAQISLSGARYTDANRLQRTALLMLDRLRAAPGVESASIVNYLPLALIRVGVPVSIEGSRPLQSDERPVARYWVTTPGYFETVGIPILAGRDFTDADDMLHAGAAIVSETSARRFWNTTDVVGRRIRAEFPQSDAFWIPRGSREWRTIVGVVADVREDGIPDIAGAPQMYLPFAQNPTVVMTLLARDRPGGREVAPGAIREAVSSVDPQAPVSYEMAMGDVVQESFARPREMAWIVGAFAILALVLSATGVYGLMAFLTATRTREIEVRVALGAAPIDVVSLIVTYAFKLTVAGVVIGAVLSPLALRLAASLLFGVGPFDAPTLVAVAALLGSVALTAALIPAVRAARTTSVRLR
jgi:putative ABC transport system permease protein